MLDTVQILYYASNMDKKRRPSRRVENPTERVCKTCGINKPIDRYQPQNATREQDWVTYRQSCRVCESAKAMQRYEARKIAVKCSHCGAETPTAGYTTCQTCREQNAIARDNSTNMLRAQVLLAYGRKCAHCGDRRLECLEIDHVGGWGNEHKDLRGRRLTGYGLWVWIRDNGFPKSIRLLCGSCHSALSYWKLLPRMNFNGATIETDVQCTHNS